MTGRRGRGWALAALLAAAVASGCETNADRSGGDEPVSAAPREQVATPERSRPRAAHREQRRAARRARRKRAARRSLRGLDELAAELDAEVGVSVLPTGGPAKPLSAGGLRSGSAWSTIKVPIALRVLEDVGGPAGLSDRQREDIAAAITASDNEAAARLYADLSQTHGGPDSAAAAVTRVLERTGDRHTRVATVGREGFSPYGQTEWSLEAQGRFMAALVGGCIGDRASRRLLLELMGEVTADRWGLGSSGVPARWKGGWGPGTDGRYLVRQMGVVELGNEQIVVTVAARSGDGGFESSTAAASAAARWLVDRLGGVRLTPQACPTTAP